MKSLSKREFEVNTLIAKGYQVKEIATKLFISPYTVDTHIKNIKKKTGSKNIADMVRVFILGLDNPKQFFSALTFLIIQMNIVFGNVDFDVRRVRRSARVVRVRKNIGSLTFWYKL